MWFVNSALKQQRMEICKSCEHFTNKTTCGTPVIGNEVIVNGEVLHTCGCIMTVKTSLSAEHCPLGKWSSERLSKVDGCALKDFILSLYEYHVTNEQLQKLFSYKSKISGRHEQVTTCPSCVKDLIENLKKQIRNLEC
jgi:iron-sulfur cluster repair protein YtfE (RIC family)